jgi:hypothetical protein
MIKFPHDKQEQEGALRYSLGFRDCGTVDRDLEGMLLVNTFRRSGWVDFPAAGAPRGREASEVLTPFLSNSVGVEVSNSVLPPRLGVPAEVGTWQIVYDVQVFSAPRVLVPCHYAPKKMTAWVTVAPHEPSEWMEMVRNLPVPGGWRFRHYGSISNHEIYVVSIESHFRVYHSSV